MKTIVRVQYCWDGGEKFFFRALICGGLRVHAPAGKWTRKVASEMLDLLEVEAGLDRKKVRFVHT